MNALRVDGKPVYETLRTFGIKTIVRYYDHDNETLICKTLLNDEAKSIIDNGFQIAVVFQHHNGSPHTFFSETRGTKDAERALALAKHNGQPPNTTIFFGVDGPDQIIASTVYMYKLAGGGPITPALAKKYRWTSTNIKQYNDFLDYGPKRFGPDLSRVQEKDILPYVVKYFERVAKVFKASSDAGGPSYKIGVYGSGLVCAELLPRKDLVTDCWLAQSVGWPNYDSYRKNGKWAIMQKNPTYCPTWINIREKKRLVGFDFNFVRPEKADFGQWKSKLSGTTDFKRPKSCPPL